MLKAQVGLFVACCFFASAVQAQGTFTRTRELKVDPGTWVAAKPLVAPTLPDGVSGGSAGCIVVGQHVDAAGTTSKPRVMQWAFTKDISADAQKAFIARALGASAQWRFRFEPPANVPAALKRDVEASAAPDWAFHRVVMGFASSAPGAVPTAMFDADKQDARVAAQCQLEPLAEWGKRNAVAVEVAKARAGDPLLVAKQSSDSAYWVSNGDMAVPNFPVAAVRAGVDACVIVGFIIGVDGAPTEFRVMRTSTVAPPPLRKAFEDAALGAALTWRYAPGPDNLKRLPEFRQTPVRFNSDRVRRQSECEAVDLSESK